MNIRFSFFTCFCLLLVYACDESNSINKHTLTSDTASLATSIHQSNDFHQYLPKGYVIPKNGDKEMLVQGDLNNDGIEDTAILLLKGDTLPEDIDFEHEVHLCVVWSNDKKSGNRISLSGNLSGESLRYNTDNIISIHDSILTFVLQSMRHDVEARFQWIPESKELYLISSKQSSYGMNGGSISFDYKTGEQIVVNHNYNEETDDIETIENERKILPHELIEIQRVTVDSLYSKL